MTSPQLLLSPAFDPAIDIASVTLGTAAVIAPRPYV